MGFLNFGSLNRDLVYSVPHAVRPGETIASRRMDEFVGGKGLNQSLALARAGAEVYHAGCVGADGESLHQILNASGVNTDFIRQVDCPSGHAIIQLDENGQNSIVLFGGANQLVTRAQIDEVLARFAEKDSLVLQNKISELPYLIERAAQRKMRVILNPSPFPAYHGKGYGSRAFGLTADYAEQSLNVRVTARCFLENTPSRRMIAANGFIPVRRDDTYEYFVRKPAANH